MPKRDTRRIAAVSFDYWDTLYSGDVLPERVALRRSAVGELLGRYGRTLDAQEIERLYAEAGREADRWWREEHRGYTTAERLRYLLQRADVEAPEGCEHVAACAAAVDDALLAYPPPLLPGARELVTRLAERMPLAIVSDTGFASGHAQTRLLEHDGIREHFIATVYSMDVGWAKPRREPFDAAIGAFAARGIRPDQVVHVGDIERTDVRGALAAGMRAVRIDVVRRSGPSAAEFVASSFEELEAWLVT